MKVTSTDQLKHGMRVTCKIGGFDITDAKISISSNGNTYICQDKRDGAYAEDNLGYKHSWLFYSPFSDRGFEVSVRYNDVSDLETLLVKSNLMESIKDMLKSKNQRLLEKYALSSDGNIDFTKEAVQKAFFKAFKKEILVECEEIEKREKVD